LLSDSSSIPISSTKATPVFSTLSFQSDHGSRRPDLLFRVGAGIVVMASAVAMSGCGGADAGAGESAAGEGSASATSAAAPGSTSATPTAPPVAATGSSSGSPAAAGQGPALAALATLPVKGRAPKTGYSREQFGQAWADVDHNGCDTRNDILARDLTSRTTRPGTRDCIVTSGVLNDPYTGSIIHFKRGEKTSNAVQIDHVVALSNAWQTGAQQLSASTREQLANDPLELLAVDGPSNEEKSDGDAATWLPANKPFRCQYVARQVEVKVQYKLWVTPAEHDAIAGILSGCKGQKLPGAGAPTVVWKAETAPSSAEAKASAPVQKAGNKSAPKSSSTTKKVVKKVASNTALDKAEARRKQAKHGSSVYYANCAAAREAGAAPMHKGDPGYRSGLDRDHDGVACE
jgi:hypothetical protein